MDAIHIVEVTSPGFTCTKEIFNCPYSVQKCGRKSKVIHDKEKNVNGMEVRPDHYRIYKE